MKQLIARYDAEWRQRLAAIAKTVSSAGSAPAYAYALNTVKTLPPLRPSVQLNAGGNYVEHEQGIATNQARGRAAQPARRRRGHVCAGHMGAPGRDTRDNPTCSRSRRRRRAPRQIVVPRGRTN